MKHLQRKLWLDQLIEHLNDLPESLQEYNYDMDDLEDETHRSIALQEYMNMIMDDMGIPEEFRQELLEDLE